MSREIVETVSVRGHVFEFDILFYFFATKPRRDSKCGNHVRTRKVLGNTLEFVRYWEILTLELFKVLESICFIFLKVVGSTYLRILKLLNST